MGLRSADAPITSPGESRPPALSEGTTRLLLIDCPDDVHAGCDPEFLVLARALTLLLEERVFLSGDRAVVFA